MTAPHGSIAWHELNTRHIEANRAHYTEVYGWAWQESPMPGGDGTYYIAMLGEEMVAGMFDMTGQPGMEDMPDHWMIYLAVRDCDASADDVTAHGGTVMRPPFDVPGVGRFAIVKDAGGAAFGIMQDAG